MVSTVVSLKLLDEKEAWYLARFRLVYLYTLHSFYVYIPNPFPDNEDFAVLYILNISACQETFTYPPQLIKVRAQQRMYEMVKFDIYEGVGGFFTVDGSMNFQYQYVSHQIPQWNLR